MLGYVDLKKERKKERKKEKMRDYHVEQLDDERILENFLTCFRDLDNTNTDQCKYVLRLRSIIAGTARAIVIELDDLRTFSKSEVNPLRLNEYPNT